MHTLLTFLLLLVIAIALLTLHEPGWRVHIHRPTNRMRIEYRLRVSADGLHLEEVSRLTTIHPQEG